MTPYQYTANNPFNAVDVNGDSIIVLTAPDGVARGAGIGHAAVLISDPENQGQWLLYSSNRAEGGLPFGPQANEDRGTSVGTLQEFWEGEYSRLDGEIYYTEGYLLASDGETDAQMADAALEGLGEDYAVVGNSCISLCSNALEAGGFDGGSSNPIPNVRYDAIKENNEGGTVIPHPDIQQQRQPSVRDAINDVLLNTTREIERMIRGVTQIPQIP